MNKTFKILLVAVLLVVAGVFVKNNLTGFAAKPGPTLPYCSMDNITVIFSPNPVKDNAYVDGYLQGIHGECGTVTVEMSMSGQILCTANGMNSPCTFKSPSRSGGYTIDTTVNASGKVVKLHPMLNVCWSDGHNVSDEGGFCCNTQCSDNVCRSSCCAGLNESSNIYPKGCCEGLTTCSDGACRFADAKACSQDSQCCSNSCINGTCQTATTTCLANNLNNGDFSYKLNCWKTLSSGGGAEYISYSGDNYNGRIISNSPNDGCVGRLYQNVNLNVGVLSFDVKVDQQTLTSTECSMYYIPAGVYIEYIDNSNTSHSWWHGYYLSGNVTDCADKVSKGKWVHESVDLTKISPSPSKVTKIQFFAGGWDYDTKYDNVKYTEAQQICSVNEEESNLIQQGEYTTKVYHIGDNTYTVEIPIISDSDKTVKFKVNNETTDALSENEVYTLNDGTEVGVVKVMPNEGSEAVGADQVVFNIFTTNNFCSDNKDNDCDKLIDKNDSDCQTILYSEKDSLTATQNEYTTKTYDIGGKEYDVAVNIISTDGSVKFTINNETTDALSAGQTYTLSNGSTIMVNSVSLNEGSDADQVTFTLGFNYCNNGIDDDNDGYVDMSDSDCGLKNEAASLTLTQNEYTTKTYDIGGKEYDVAVNIISTDGSVKFTINNETTDALSAGQTYTLSNGSTIMVNSVSLNEGSDADQVTFTLGFNYCNNGIDDDNDALIDLEDSDCQAPAAPTGLHLISSNKNDTSFLIGWNAVNGTNYYKVYIKSEYGNNFTLVGTTTGTTYNDGTPANDAIKYYYKVSSVKNNIEGSQSDSITVSFNSNNNSTTNNNTNHNTTNNNVDNNSNGGNDGGSGGGGGKPQPGPVPTSTNGGIIQSIINFFASLFR